MLVAPAVLVLTGERPPGRGFAWDFALALGYSGLVMTVLQFWLTARFKRVAAPFGIDILYYFHRYLAMVAVAVLGLHAAVLWLGFRTAVGSLDPRSAPLYLTLGVLGLLGFVGLLASSLWRKQLRIEYDRWRRGHVLLAVLAVAASLAHVAGAGNYLADTGGRWLWAILAASWLGLVLYVRLVRPLRLRGRPYRVESIVPVAGRSWTLRLRPQSGPVIRYRAGQFAWLTLRASPLALREHPFSFSSCPESGDAVEFTIKELGDFTARIGQTQPGEIAYVDGPYGSFGIDHQADAPGYVFIAGGVGIAPIFSLLRSLAARGERRPLWVFYGNRNWDRVVFRDELAQLANALDLTVVHVLGEPPEGWAGERGFVTSDILGRHLPPTRSALHYYVCGPTPMIRLAEQGLAALGVPLRQVHSELFDLA